MTEKRFTIAVYDDKAVNGFAVLDLQKPNNSKRLKYENVYIGSKVGCEIVCNVGKSLADENEQLKKKILEEIDLEVAYVNETYSDGRMSKEQHNGAIISLRQLREKFE